MMLRFFLGFFCFPFWIGGVGALNGRLTINGEEIGIAVSIIFVAIGVLLFFAACAFDDRRERRNG